MMISISYSEKNSGKIPVLVPLYTEDLDPQKRKILRGLTRAQKRAVRSALVKGLRPESGCMTVFSGDAPVFIYVIGKQKESQRREIRESGEKIFTFSKQYCVEKIIIAPGSLNKSLFSVFQEGVVLGSYDFTEYKGTKKNDEKKKEKFLTNVVFFASSSKKVSDEIIHKSQGVQITKDLINMPPSDANPTYVVELAQKIARTNSKITSKIFGKKELEKMNCGGILGVGRGSRHESRLIVLEYKNGKSSEKPIILVGKGVTFDTGGNNIKGNHMRWMKQDLGGAATVLGAFSAIVQLDIKKNVCAVVPTVENVVDKDSYFPDDILTMYNGMTVEVHNTDAEGRLILADALSYADDKLKPRAMVDLATLTGACFYAVGDDFIAGLSTDKKLFSALEQSSKEVDEPLWELPLHKRYAKTYLKSSTADIVNCGDGPRAGTIEGGFFCKIL
jgi:leucyl aminopeptidase